METVPCHGGRDDERDPMNIISRDQWGASPWVNQPDTVPDSERTEFYIHYDGATWITRTGNSIPKAIESEHLGNGWSGIGYHFVVSQAGEIFEGRGWDLQGAHCPNHNRSAIGVQIAVGGDQEPTKEALSAARALYDFACQKYGRALEKHGHRDGFATDCPGAKLYAWVQGGMQVDTPVQVPSPAPTPNHPWPGVYVQRGSRGDMVRTVQARLSARGWAIGVDGDFGPQTDRVVRQFQAEKGLGADGIVGPKTWNALWNAPIT